uniref:SDE2 telomere maintenance homolog (S. pombe) n=1 Tax=Maylandia zebra TaxID=106582 RepID=A0A3P9CD90_9CICH
MIEGFISASFHVSRISTSPEMGAGHTWTILWSMEPSIIWSSASLEGKEVSKRKVASSFPAAEELKETCEMCFRVRFNAARAGAQIEKTTNREACRDLSGRRLRDVNHEKEMADWLKKQAEREAEKEQRRLERLQRKLNEPKHQFTDAEYQQQCHDLSERLEDSVLRGLQASSSSQVKVDDMCGAKRLNCDQSEQPAKKKTKTAGGGGCFWTGLEEMDELMSSDDDEAPSTSSRETAAAIVTMTTRREAEEGSSGSTRTTQIPKETSRDQTGTPSEDRDSEKTSRDQTGTPSEDQNHPGPSKPSQSSEPSQQVCTR